MSVFNGSPVELQDTFELAQQICDGMYPGAFVTIGKIVDGGANFVSLGGFVGVKSLPQKVAQAQCKASAKFAVLFGQVPSRNEVLCTPIKEVSGISNWMGGCRQDDWIVSVSNWSPVHNKLLALVLLYSLQNPIVWREGVNTLIQARSGTGHPTPVADCWPFKVQDTGGFLNYVSKPFGSTSPVFWSGEKGHAGAVFVIDHFGRNIGVSAISDG